jgi:alpha-1,6-mannosyltransferase
MPKITLYLFLSISLVGYILTGYFINRADFTFLIGVYSTLFILYFITLNYKNKLDFNTLLISGILFRFCLIFSFPALSDDFYRFIWDGRIQQLGFNPFDFTPTQILNLSSDDFLKQLFPKLNSPNYYSVYPQFCQIVFRICSLIGQDNLLNNLIALKSMIFLAELGTIYVLHKLILLTKKEPSLLFIYTLNPLVIIELSGNVHFEAFMIFFFMLAVLLLYQQKNASSFTALALAIQAKLLPLLAIPLLLKKIGLKKTVLYALGTLCVFLLMSIDLFIKPERTFNILESLNLYYGKFEFNGGFYLFLRTIGWHVLGYNPIEVLSKILIVLSLSSMLIILIKEKNVFGGFFWLLCIYFAFGAVIHPWYLTTLVALSIFVRYRFILLWSALIPLSYSTYSSIPYQENYWLIATEYLLVIAFFIWEITVRKKDPCIILSRIK